MTDARNDDHEQQGQKGSADIARPPHSQSAESAVPTPFSDWCDSTLKLLSEIKNYWKDRKTILDNSTVIRDRVQLKNRPFNFALHGLLLPSLLIGLVYSAISAVYPLPPSQVDRAIEAQKNLQTALDDAIGNLHLKAESEPFWAQQMSTEEMEKEMKRNRKRLEDFDAKRETKKRVSQQEVSEVREVMNRLLDLTQIYTDRTTRELQASIAVSQKEAAENQLRLLRWKKFANFVNGWQNFIVGIALILAAYFFGSSIRRLKPTPMFASHAADASLYTIGAALIFPSTLAALLNVGLDLSMRYDKDWFLKIHPFLIFVLVAWVFVVLLGTGDKLADALGEATRTATGKRQRRVTWHLFLAQFSATVIVQLAVAAIRVPLFWVVSKFNK